MEKFSAGVYKAYEVATQKNQKTQKDVILSCSSLVVSAC